MPLQIDATVIYARGDPEEPQALDADRTSRSSRRTTRTSNTGLPPTPIAAVSDASLQAALAPAETDYLYYVLTDKDGHHAFSSHARGTRSRTSTAAQAAGRAVIPARPGSPASSAIRCGTRCRPVLHNAAYRALGLDWVLRRVRGARRRTQPRALDAVRALGLVGLSVTMPHKTAIAARATSSRPTPPRCAASTP